MANEDKKKMVIKIGYDTKELLSSSQEVVRIIDSLVSQVTKALSGLSKIKVEGFDFAERAKPEMSSLTMKDYDEQIAEKSSKLRRARSQKNIDKYNGELNRLRREKYYYETSTPLLSQKGFYKGGEQIGAETKSVRTWKYGETQDMVGRTVDLLAKEENIVKTIQDQKTGEEKTVTRIVRSQEKLTASGKRYEVVADNTYEDIKKINEEQLKSSGKKNFLTTLFARFKSVAIYRGIRNILKELVNSFNESIAGISKVNKSFNKSISQINSDLSKLKAISGVVLYQILMAIQPTITGITNSIVEFANKLSLSLALIQKNGEYVKINTEYWKDYQDTMNGTLLSFDTFNTLSSNSNIDWNKMLINEDISNVTKEEKEDVSSLIDILSSLKDIVWSLANTLSKIWDNIIKPIIDSGIIDFIIDLVGSIITLTAKTGLLGFALFSIITLVSLNKVTSFFEKVIPLISKLTTKITDFANKSIKSVTESTYNFKLFGQQLSKTQVVMSALAGVASFMLFDSILSGLGEDARKTVAPIMTFVGALVALTTALLAVTTVIRWGVALPVILGSIGAVVAGVKGMISTDVNSYATGGTFDSGDFFMANENGNTELVASSNSGGGNVMNLDQWGDVSTMSMYNALVMYNAAKDNGNIDIDSLGTAIARSKGFKNELNRTNNLSLV